MLDFDNARLTERHTAGNAPGDDTGAEYVIEAITSRRSVRGFKPDPVPREMIEHLLAVASRAPSGTNMQPWKAYVTTGETKQRLTDEIIASVSNGEKPAPRPWKYYPDEFPPVYKARRRKIGWDLYGLAGIERGETEKMADFRDRNYKFFDAPVGIIFSIDERLEIGSWLDYGCFLQNLMIAARAHGLSTCPQAAFADVHAPIRRVLPIPDGETVVCGMAIGTIDDAVDVNALETERSPVSEFATFFED